MPKIPPQQTASQVTRLPLAKFSHTTTGIHHSGPFSWDHVNGCDDLVCLLDKFPGSASTPSRLVLRVASNHGILEQIDLEHFVRMTANQSQSVSNTSSSKLPFVVVVKKPSLAVKYPQNQTYVRRFQIKFSQERDYYSALAILSEINCPWTEGSASSMQVPRPPSSCSWTSAPSVQLLTTASKDVNKAITPVSNATVPFYPMLGYQTGGITTPNPPSSSSSNIHNLVSAADEAPNGECLQHNPPHLVPQSKCTGTEEASIRPVTAPAYHDERQLNEMLPPRRELPFSKAKQKTSRATTSSQRAAKVPASQEPSVTEPVDPAMPSSLYRPMGHNPLERRDSLIVPDLQSQSLPPTQSWAGPIETSRISPELESTQPNPEWWKRLPGQQLPEVLVPASSAEPPHDDTNNMQNRQTQLFATHPTAANNVENQLSLYLSSPTPERIAFLENWMCELIEDDRFMTLCQDVEATWRRFAFGMKR